MSLPDQSFTRNLLLSRLDPPDWALLQPHLERIPLSRGDVMIEESEPIQWVHFLEGGVASVVASDSGDPFEVGLIGREGFIGVPLLLGSDRTPERCFIQVDGSTALRMAAEPFLAATGAHARLRNALLRFAQVQNIQVSRTASSNAGMELPQRLARWLLMCHDRIDSDAIGLTHDFISMMLGVRRSGVTVSLHTLEGMGLIAAKRGLVTILDRMRLEELAGDAYGRPEAEYRRLLGPFGRSEIAGK